jgi:hypothetical protein
VIGVDSNAYRRLMIGYRRIPRRERRTPCQEITPTGTRLWVRDVMVGTPSSPFHTSSSKSPGAHVNRKPGRSLRLASSIRREVHAAVFQVPTGLVSGDADPALRGLEQRPITFVTVPMLLVAVALIAC